MVDQPAIEVRGISKAFRLGARSGPTRLSEAVSERVAGLFRRRLRGGRATEKLQALQDLSFDVARGEILGLVGRNGAGKSTLLKVLSRIVPPDEGQAVIRGRLSSLLEVGTGFHPELTGRENVFLNGTILGMPRQEIRRSFDEIVAFAELERFIDTPVKRYSSGMYMRLAFAVAAHLQSDVMLVDEVLAVGDAAFQRKCLGRMSETAHDGRTVIFVSHNLGSVSQLCRQALWLDKGVMQALGETDQVLAAYTEEFAGGQASASFAVDTSRDAQVLEVSIRNGAGDVAGEISCDDGVEIRVQVAVHRRVPGASVALWLRNHSGVTVLSSDVLHTQPDASDRILPGLHEFRVDVPRRLLAPNTYYLSAGIVSRYEGSVDHVADACSVAIVDHSTSTGGTRAGVIGLNLPWTHTRVD